jgi:hypothetical protein
VDSTEPVIWYATEARVFALWKFAWDDDRGRIDPDRGGVRFVGQKMTLRMAQLTADPRRAWIIPWAAVASLVLGNTLILLLANAGVFNYLTLENPPTYIVLLLIDSFALASWPMQWVRVESIDDRGNPARAYFTIGSAVGRWNGGLRRLQTRLQECMQVE